MPVSEMETPSSQDVHSQVLAAILAPIRDLNENFKVDLSAHLETYLRELCDGGGMASVNFVEAALLIQRSAGIYGKKVEYLWQLLMQVLDSFRKKGVPGEKGNEKRRKTAANVSELLQDFVDITVTLDKKKWKGKQFGIKLDPPYYSELEYNCPREKKLSLFDGMADPVGDKSDFRLNYAISDTFMLEEELSHLDCGSNSDLEFVGTTEDDDANAGGDTSMQVDDYDDGGGGDCGVDNDDHEIVTGMDGGGDGPPAGAELELEPETQTADPEPCGPERERIGQQPVNEERIVTVGEKVSWGSDSGDIPDKVMKVQDRCKAPSCLTSERNDCDSVSSLVTGCVPISFGRASEEVPKFRLEFIKASKNKKKTKEQRRTDEIEEYRKILATDFTGDFLGFEDYEPSSGEEDGFHGYPAEDDADNDGADDNVVEGEEDAEGSAAAAAATSAADAVRELDALPLPNVIVPSDNSDWTQVYQNILQEKMHSARVGHQDTQAALATRVNHWHESIRPKLKIAEERGSMDIHEYGTRILETFPKGSAKTTINFAQVVKGKEIEEISRYFLATLMLANTYNVEIRRTNPRPLAMNCIELTLLSSTRHHEALDEYQAPSQAEQQVERRNKSGGKGGKSSAKSSAKSCASTSQR